MRPAADRKLADVFSHIDAERERFAARLIDYVRHPSISILGIPAFVTPYGNADEANHAPNENFKLDCFHNGIRTGAALLHQIGQARSSRAVL